MRICLVFVGLVLVWFVCVCVVRAWVWSFVGLVLV